MDREAWHVAVHGVVKSQSRLSDLRECKEGGPTSEIPFTNTISNQSFNYSKESVFRQFRTSPASHSWEALNNHMWKNLFRQARGLPKQFVG